MDFERQYSSNRDRPSGSDIRFRLDPSRQRSQPSGPLVLPALSRASTPASCGSAASTCLRFRTCTPVSSRNRRCTREDLSLHVLPHTDSVVWPRSQTHLRQYTCHERLDAIPIGRWATYHKVKHNALRALASRSLIREGSSASVRTSCSIKCPSEA